MIDSRGTSRPPEEGTCPALGAELLLSENVTGFRWWALEELDAYRGEDIFAPRDLAALTTQLLRDGIPQAPLALGI